MLILCDVCNKDITGSGFNGAAKHVCSRDDIIAYVNQLTNHANDAERKLNQVRSAVLKILTSIPNIEKPTHTFPADLITELWEAAVLRDRDIETAAEYHNQWMSLHRILCEAFDLFRPLKHGRAETLLARLEALKKVCLHAQAIHGYTDSKLTLTPQDIIAEAKLG